MQFGRQGTYLMPEGDLSSSKSKGAAAFTLLCPTTFTIERPVRCLDRCETSFAPEQQLSANTGNEKPNIFNSDITVCQIFTVNPLLFELSRLSKDQSSSDSMGFFLYMTRKMPTHLCGNFRTKSVSCMHLKGMACLLTPLQGPSTSA